MVPSGRPTKGAGGGEQSGTRASEFGLADDGRFGDFGLVHLILYLFFFFFARASRSLTSANNNAGPLLRVSYVKLRDNSKSLQRWLPYSRKK
jgi:hypothetical protein